MSKKLGQPQARQNAANIGGSMEEKEGWGYFWLRVAVGVNPNISGGLEYLIFLAVYSCEQAYCSIPGGQ